MTEPIEDKTLDNASIAEVREKVSDVKVIGNGDLFQVLSKASSAAQGWMKSTKAMEIPGVGCLVQVTTQQRNSDGSYSVAEALQMVPGVRIVEDIGGGRQLLKYGQVEPMRKTGLHYFSNDREILIGEEATIFSGTPDMKALEICRDADGRAGMKLEDGKIEAITHKNIQQLRIRPQKEQRP